MAGGFAHSAQRYVIKQSTARAGAVVTVFQLGVLRCFGAGLLVALEFFYIKNGSSLLWARYLFGVHTAATFSLGIADLCAAQKSPIDATLKSLIETLYCVSVALMLVGFYYSWECLSGICFITGHSLLLPKIRYHPKFVLPVIALHFPLIHKHMYSIVRAHYLVYPKIRNIGSIFHTLLVVYYKIPIFRRVSQRDMMVLFLVVAISSGLIFGLCDGLMRMQGYYALYRLTQTKLYSTYVLTTNIFKTKKKPPSNYGSIKTATNRQKNNKPSSVLSKGFYSFLSKKTPAQSRIAPSSHQIKKPTSVSPRSKKKQTSKAWW